MASKPTIAVVADAVVAELNSRTWVQAFTAERAWLPRIVSAELKQMQVTVMLGGGIKQLGASVQSLFNRGYRQRTHEVQIAFMKNVNKDNKAAVDALAAFVEDVADYYGADAVNGGKRKVAGTEAIVTEVLVDPVASPEQLDENGRFFSVVSLIIGELSPVVPQE